MKKRLIVVFFIIIICFAPLQRANAQMAIAEIIKAAIVKVIKAVDLKIQRLQNKTIWLQNAQKTLENTMSKLKLDEITNWVEKQKQLYEDYFNELQTVKAVISYYRRVKDITEKQVHLVQEYKRSWALFKQDKHFTPDELAYMERVYKGILDESVKNLDQIVLVINSFQTQMTDAKRLEIINAAADRIDVNLDDLRTFNGQGILISLQRSKVQNDIDAVKKLYGIQ